MSVGRYFTGILLLCVALVPLQTAAYLWRARLVREWRGAQARLAEIVIDVSVIICVSEVLGSVHLYRTVPMVISLALVGVGASVVATRVAGSGPGEISAPLRSDARSSRGANVVAVVAISILVAEWSTRIVSAYHHGMLSTDTLWYHMPYAARFVQDGSITAIHYVDAEPVTAFFPASSELFHSLGILLMGNDVLSPVLNTVWLGVALLASWCIGAPFGVAPITVTGSAILFATPGLVATQPGGAYDDVVGLALFLAAVALLINSTGLSERSSRAGWAMAAASAGLAVGTKWTLLGPVAVLTVVLFFVAPRGRRLRRVGLWLAFLLLTGAFWYVRNFVAVGNPLPPLHLKLGPLSLPSPKLTAPSSTVAQFLLNTSDWRQYFLPGLRLSFGPAWWALLGLSGLGLVIATLRGDRLQRILGVVGLASGIIFLFSPQFVAILGVPVMFAYNVRYADAVVILGLVLLPINPMFSMASRARWILVAYAAILVTTQFDSSIWPTTFFADRFGPPVGGVDSLLGLFIGLIALGIGMLFLFRRKTPSRRRTFVLVGSLICAFAVVAGFPLQQTYLRDRYTGPGVGQSLAYPFFQRLSNARVGVLGYLTILQYPYYGENLSNHVQYLGMQGPQGSYSDLDSCQSLREAISNGHYSFVVITTGLVRTREDASEATPEMRWIEAGKESKTVFKALSRTGNPYTGYFGTTVFKLSPHFSADECDAPHEGGSVVGS